MYKQYRKEEEKIAIKYTKLTFKFNYFYKSPAYRSNKPNRHFSCVTLGTVNLKMNIENVTKKAG